MAAEIEWGEESVCEDCGWNYTEMECPHCNPRDDVDDVDEDWSWFVQYGEPWDEEMRAEMRAERAKHRDCDA